MARPFLIIDGYNLMHAAGLARRRYGPGDLERCRNRLITGLASRLSPAAAARTKIVFDAFTAESDLKRHQAAHGLNIVFAPSGTDADSEIERRIAAHPAPRQLLIVSSDHRLHKAAKKRRARSIDSEEFWNSLGDDTELATKPAGKPEPEADDHPAEFLNIDVPDDRGSSDEFFDADYLDDLESELEL